MSRTRDVKADLMQWVDEQYQLEPRRKYVLDKLARFGDAECCAWAKVAELADRTNQSERFVQKVLREFERDGLIRSTGREHTLNPGSKYPRKVPIYQLAVGVVGLDPKAEVSGARRAPEPGLGCTDATAGVHTGAPRNELTGTELHTDARALERKALFGRLEEAYPPRGLGFSNRDRAWVAFNELLDEGFGGERLVEAAAYFAEGVPPKLRDTGLDYWLADRRFRAWLERPKAAETAPATEAAPAFAPPRDVADVLYAMGRDWVGSWLRGAQWLEADRLIVCKLGLQSNEVRKAVGRKLADIGVTVTNAKEHELVGANQ